MNANDNADCKRTSLDFGASRDRFGTIRQTLRDQVVCEGWWLDERLTERAAAYFRQDDPDHKSFEDLISFCSQHNQSLDWILLGDARGAIFEAASRSRQAAIPRRANVVCFRPAE